MSNENELNELESFFIKQIRSGILDLLTAQEKVIQKHVDIKTKTQAMQKSVGKLKERIYTIEKQCEILSYK